MKKNIILFISILCTFFSFITISNAAKNTFSCDYTIESYSLNSAIAGKISCTMGEETVFFIKNPIYDCKWTTGGDKVDVNEHGTDSFDLKKHLLAGNTCPSYVAIQTSSQSYATSKYFTDSVHAYFTDNLEDAKFQATKFGTYYATGDLDGLENSELDKWHCDTLKDNYYEDLFEKFENQINDFLDDDCNNFTLTEEEIENGIAFPSSFKKYEKCEKHLGFSQSYFNSTIKDLEKLYRQCFDKDTYEENLSTLKSYKSRYNELLNNLKDSFVEQPDAPSDNPDNPDRDDPEYKVEDTDLSTICSSPEYRKPMKFVGVILNFIKIIVPIIIIGFGVLDLYKAITANKDDGLKKSFKAIGVRIGAGVFIFLLPGIVQFALNMVNEWSDYKNVWCCCTDCLLNPDCDVNSCSTDSCQIEGTNK